MSFKIIKYDQMSKDEWDKNVSLMSGNQHLCSWNSIRYQSQTEKTKNISFSLFEGKKCIAIVPLGTAQVDLKNYVLVKSKNNEKVFGFGNNHCPEPILNKDCNNYEKKKILSNIREILIDLSKKYKIYNYRTRNHPVIFEKDKPFLSSKNQFYSLKWSYDFVVHNTIILDLKNSIEEIWNNFSKYHRKNIKRALKNKIEFRCINHQTKKKTIDEKFNNFKEAHFVSAGFKTRLDSSWETMKKMLIEKEGVLFILKYENKDISFLYCGTYKNFSWGWSQVNNQSYEKELMPRHLLEWETIKYLKKNKFNFYDVGQTFYSKGSETPSKKESSISDFKEKYNGLNYPRAYFFSNLKSKNI